MQPERNIADAYGRYSKVYASILDPTLKPMADEILRIGGGSGRELVMDLATGTGIIANAAAVAGKSVIGVDISLGMLVTARKITGGKIPFINADAMALSFLDHIFDLVTCGISLSHFADVTLALNEVRRVLLPGGSFVASVWSSEKEDPSFSVIFKVLEDYMGDMVNPFAGLLDEDAWANTEHGCEVLERAGFTEVQVTTLPLSGIYRSPSAAVQWAFAWPLIRERVDSLDPTTRNELQAEAIETVDSVRNLVWHRAIHYYKATNPA